MTILIMLFKLHLQIIYFFLKLLPTNSKKVLLMSRQSNVQTVDFVLIEAEIKKRFTNYKVVSLTKKLEKKARAIISYYFSMYVQMFHLATAKACVVDSYIIPVSVLKHKKNLLIIQLNHGIGNIKKFGYQTLNKESGRDEKLAKLMKLHHNYDYVISNSAAVSKFYAEAFNVPITQLLNFGQPKIDYILNIRSQQENILKKYPGLKDKPVILYFSTFRAYEDDYLEKFIAKMPLQNYNIIIYPHFVMYEKHPSLAQKLDVPGVYRCKDEFISDLLSVADYVVTDYSSFMFESAILGISTYLFIPDYDKYTEKNGLNVDVAKELKPYAYRDAEKLFAAIAKGKYEPKTLKAFKACYIENANGDSTTKLVDLIIKGK